MRENCRHFQSRTYDTGEVARFCVLNLAPEAPWRCPDDCRRFEADSINTGFVVGPLVRPDVEPEPDEPPGVIAQLLDDADAIVTAAGPDIIAQVEAERRKQPWWQRWRKRGDKGDGRLHLRDG